MHARLYSQHTDAKGHTQSQALSINVAEAISIVTSATLPNGIFGQAYNQTIQTQDGVSPIAFGITGGALPGGLTLDPATGRADR